MYQHRIIRIIRIIRSRKDDWQPHFCVTRYSHHFFNTETQRTLRESHRYKTPSVTERPKGLHRELPLCFDGRSLCARPLGLSCSLCDWLYILCVLCVSVLKKLPPQHTQGFSRYEVRGTRYEITLLWSILPASYSRTSYLVPRFIRARRPSAGRRRPWAGRARRRGPRRGRRRPGPSCR